MRHYPVVAFDHFARGLGVIALTRIGKSPITYIVEIKTQTGKSQDDPGSEPADRPALGFVAGYVGCLGGFWAFHAPILASKCGPPDIKCAI